MATKPVTKKEEIDMEERVDFFIPINPAEPNDTDVVLSINGETVVIQRGEKVKLKRKFVELYQNNEMQNMAAIKYIKSIASN